MKMLIKQSPTVPEVAEVAYLMKWIRSGVLPALSQDNARVVVPVRSGNPASQRKHFVVIGKEAAEAIYRALFNSRTTR